MGILKVIRKPEADAAYLQHAVDYLINGHSLLYGGFNVCPERAYEQMQSVKAYYGKTDANQLVHFVISFNSRVWKIGYAEKLARKIAKYYADRYQILYAVHGEVRMNQRGEAANMLHVHMLVNTVDFVDGRVLADDEEAYRKFAEHVAKMTGDRHWKLCFGDGTTC